MYMCQLYSQRMGFFFPPPLVKSLLYLIEHFPALEDPLYSESLGPPYALGKGSRLFPRSECRGLWALPDEICYWGRVTEAGAMKALCLESWKEGKLLILWVRFPLCWGQGQLAGSEWWKLQFVQHVVPLQAHKKDPHGEGLWREPLWPGGLYHLVPRIRKIKYGGCLVNILEIKECRSGSDFQWSEKFCFWVELESVKLCGCLKADSRTILSWMASWAKVGRGEQ